MSAWIEVLYGQDLSRLGPVEPGVHFTDTTLWTRVNSLPGAQPLPDAAVLPVGSNSIRLTWPNYAPIEGEQLQLCITHAERNGIPEPAEVYFSGTGDTDCGYHRTASRCDQALANSSNTSA